MSAPNPIPYKKRIAKDSWADRQPSTARCERSLPAIIFRPWNIGMASGCPVSQVNKELAVVAAGGGAHGPSDDHVFQIRLYAILWLHDSELNPGAVPVTRLTLSYPPEQRDVEFPTQNKSPSGQSWKGEQRLLARQSPALTRSPFSAVRGAPDVTLGNRATNIGQLPVHATRCKMVRMRTSKMHNCC